MSCSPFLSDGKGHNFRSAVCGLLPPGHPRVLLFYLAGIMHEFGLVVRLFWPAMHLEETRQKIIRSEQYLLELALQGDTACFGELIERWQRRIYGFICRYVGNADEAHDLTQDTFTKAFSNLGRLSDPERFSSWLYTIALNECRMRFRRRRKIQFVSLPEEDTEVVPIHLRDPAASPEAKLAVKEDVQVLREAFDQLPEEQKEVILMKEYQDLKFHEISEILAIPLSTVKSRMYLGLKTLRKLMENQS